LHITYLFLLVSHLKAFITAAHDTVRGTTHHQNTQGHIDEGISQKLNIQTEAQQFHQQLQKHLKKTNIGQNM
jgi:hypothetical protein